MPTPQDVVECKPLYLSYTMFYILVSVDSVSRNKILSLKYDFGGVGS